MVWVKRLGWGAAAIGLLLLVAFASLVRITVNPPDQVRQQMAAAPTVVSDPLAGLTQAQAQVQARPPIDPASLIIPVAGVQPRQLSDTWGQSRGGGTREHRAIDIMAPRGTPVLAAASGTVEKLFVSASGGNTVYVRSSDGRLIFYYAHLDSWRVAEKQPVRQGDWIASVGFTGSAVESAPHLHFEIKEMQPGEHWWQGTNVNPYPLLAFRPS